ncbi:TIGR02269 family lipoprotein [Myxococcus sp. CA039A]|uniref:SitA6 family polymorphic toxin lipoprotein n=1 Tax=Myxococcus sp. CA039A TaxID=2741737 RepID=UPI00157B1F65|nr:TIGR02269 family lipoprotein [Myxococcus sp. CA039A]NTX53422.1 TIGR02269 family lipoprotein [Myxococcus sp. CA039A]
MRILRGLWLLWVVHVLGCASAAQHPIHPAWDEAEVECARPEEDRCVTVLCSDDMCGLYRCEDLPSEVERVRFPPARPPAAAAAPGSGPRRNWGGRQGLPRGAIMVFPHWNGAPERVIPPSHQLTPGRWEKHHIFPQAEDLARWFERQGVKIHDYTMPIPRDLHRRIHGNDSRGGPWNKAWRQYRDLNQSASPEDIYKHAGELIHRFQLIGGPVQPYYSRPGA